MGRKIAYWGATGLVGLATLSAAFFYLTGAPEAVENFRNVGYPQQLRVLLGIAKLAAAIVLLAATAADLEGMGLRGLYLHVDRGNRGASPGRRREVLAASSVARGAGGFVLHAFREPRRFRHGDPGVARERNLSMKMLGPFLHMVGALLLFAGLGVEWVAIRALRRSPALGGAQQGRGEACAARSPARPSSSPPAPRWRRARSVPVRVDQRLGRGGDRHRGVGRSRHSPPTRGPSGRPALARLLAIRIALALGVLYLMVAKPGAVESLVAMTPALALGAVAAKRTRPAIA